MNLLGGPRYIGMLLVSLVILALLGGLAFYRPFQSGAWADEPALSDSGISAPLPLPVKRETFLIMGVDERPNQPGRADSMVVVSYYPATSQLAMVSLARDTWVQMPGYGFDKVNHAYAYGGARLAQNTVQALLGIPIDHTVTLSFQGFQRIIDELGGVEVAAEKRLYYLDPDDTSMGPEGLVIDIQPGQQHMDGQTALSYSRFRMDEEGDLGRIRRQQQVTRALINRVASPAVITRLPKLIQALASTIATDLSVGEMLKLATGARDALATPLRTNTFGGTARQLGGVFYLIPDLERVRSAAYETLVGSPPSDSFQARTHADQRLYDEALAEALKLDAEAAAAEAAAAEAAAAEAAAKAAAAEAAAAEAAQQNESGEAGTAAGETDEESHGDDQSSVPSPPGESDSLASQIAPRVQSVTVAIIDASGKDLGQEYARRLKVTGFKVVRVARSSKLISHTVALDHGARSSSEQLVKIIPNLSIIAAPAKTAGETVEIYLGTDL